MLAIQAACCTSFDKPHFERLLFDSPGELSSVQCTKSSRKTDPNRTVEHGWPSTVFKTALGLDKVGCVKTHCDRQRRGVYVSPLGQVQ
jgi:hypothetical protein